MITSQLWPELPYEGWSPTRDTLHRWLQIIGKVRLVQSRWVNHSWHSALYVTSTGLSTSVIHDAERSYSVDLDFISHRLHITCCEGAAFYSKQLPLQSETVASFYDRFFKALHGIGIDVRINEKPNEVPDPIIFPEDKTHCTYDPEFANRYWRTLLQADRVMKRFRSDFIGKVSPVHYFWGSNDLAVTRFSGRSAPEHPGGIPNLPDLVTKEAYSHEVSSCGFWPGNALVRFPAFYSYSYPTPLGFKSAPVQPEEAFYHDLLREYILPYDVVRTSHSPDEMLLDFFQSTYLAAATLGNWDRRSLEESPFLRALQAKHLTERAGRAA